MPVKLKPLADQVMVITGASSGIGLITARDAARQGVSVVLVARNETALRDVVAEIEAAGGQAAYAVADVGERAQVNAAAGVAIVRFGRIDTWVNCAGVAIYARLIDTPEHEHRRLFQTNYFGVVHGALTAIEHLRAQGGALITVGSIAGDIPSPVMGAYDASKHAVKGFVDSLRIEVNADRLPISVTLIKPSGMNTPIAQHAASHVDGEALIPPPVYDPQLVADAILRAAQHPVRAETVGGLGRVLVLLGTHFPAVLAKIGGSVAPLLSDSTLPKTAGSNLYRAAQDGDERADHGTGRRVSLYAAARPPLVIGALIGLAGLFVLRRRLAKKTA